MVNPNVLDRITLQHDTNNLFIVAFQHGGVMVPWLVLIENLIH